MIIQKLKLMSKTDIAAAVLMGLAFIYLIFVSFCDGTISDEAFYITIPVRLINGDGLFTDEWHLSQLSAVLTYIPVKLFIMITGGTKGIILYMRLLFTLMQTLAGAVLYKTLSKYGFTAIIASITFMLFSVIALNTLSYNTMGVALLILLICTAYSVSEKPSLIKMFLSGSLIAMFILCQPVGLVFYAAYFAAVCIFFGLSKAKNKEIPYPFTLKPFIMTIAGILPVLIFFLYLLLKNSDIGTIIRCIPGILSDVEHMVIAENLGTKTFSIIQFFSDMTMAAGLIPLILLALCIISGFFIKKINRNAALIITSAGTAVFAVILLYRLLFTGNTTETDDINFLLFPLAAAGISFYALSEKKNKKILILFWCTGVAYAVFMTISSNLGLHASVNGYLTAAVASVILAGEILKELNAAKAKDMLNKITRAAVISFTVISSFVAVGIITGTFIALNDYNHIRITEGIYAGTSLPSDQAVTYTNLRNDAEKIKEIIAPDDKIFVSENIPSVYLEGNLDMGVFSGWFIQDELRHPEIRNRFREYYELFPENIPSYIYVPAYTYGEYGLTEAPPRMSAEFPLALFEGTKEEIGSGILIRVTGIRDEQT